jgi:glycosyltransferase involved in cell wall biosynthesis
VSGLRRTVKQVQPDVAYLHHEPYGLATVQWTRALGTVPVAVYSAQNLVKRYPPPIALAERHVLHRARLALPVSESVASVLRAKGYVGATAVLPLPVDLRRFSPADAPPLHPTVGYVGRLSPEKGVDVLLHAVARSSLPSLRCAIAGTGPEELRLKHLAGELGIADRVEWAGYVAHADVQAFYQRLTVVAVPSLTVPGWTEQFGRVVIEALACGVPVVASDSGELPTLLGSTGGGAIVPEGNPEELAAAIDDWILGGTEPETDVRTAMTRVRDVYGLEAVARRFSSALATHLGEA